MANKRKLLILPRKPVWAALAGSLIAAPAAIALLPVGSPARHVRRHDSFREPFARLSVSSTSDDVVVEERVALNGKAKNSPTDDSSSLLSMVQEKMGTVSDDRLVFPDLDSGVVPRMFSSLQYAVTDEGKLLATHAAGSVVGAASLVAGTTVGAGILALPSATAAAGFLPSAAALIVAWVYMTMSGLLVAELTLNRIGETGRPGLGLLELYENSLGKPWSLVASGAYFFLHYAMMVAYISSGGNQLNTLLAGSALASVSMLPGAPQVAFAAAVALSLLFASPQTIQKANNVMVAGTVAAFTGILAIGAKTADFGSLVDPANQHPEAVVHAFPILFLALVYQNIVPTVVKQLEGDRKRVTQAIIAGTTLPLAMFLAWNAVVLGNVAGGDLEGIDPVALLQNGGGELLGSLVGAFSTLAVITSMVGFSFGLVEAWTDVFNINSNGEGFLKYKIPLFALVFAPPLALAVAIPDIFYQALEYGGTYGVSTLFLVLPPVMVWRQRYSDIEKPLTTKPMVPFGKLPLGSMWKAAATLMLEQTADKLGVFDFLSGLFPPFP
jgi:tyrosine-specific transport protein